MTEVSHFVCMVEIPLIEDKVKTLRWRIKLFNNEISMKCVLSNTKYKFLIVTVKPCITYIARGISAQGKFEFDFYEVTPADQFVSLKEPFCLQGRYKP